MKSSISLAALAILAANLVSGTVVPREPSSVNPFEGKDFYISPHYGAEVALAVANLEARGEKALAAKARKVAKVPTFIWISDRATVPTISRYLKDAAEIQKRKKKKQVVELILYNLPDRDCSAKASAGELKLSENGEALYEQFIKNAFSEIQRYPQVQVALNLEPDSIGNLVTNLAVPKCGNAAPAHKRLLSLAISILSRLPNVEIYLDGAHAGWTGWPDNLAPTVRVVGEILANAKALNRKARVRGLATNVSNYNGLGNQPQAGRDELRYINDLAPLLEAEGFPAHFIVDQGRSGNQEAPREGGDWCNFSLAGFGPRPTTNTPSPYIDAIVWIKPGGESDGTSDPTAERYDEACGSATSYKPSPEAGSWHQAYFELLIKAANPPF